MRFLVTGGGGFIGSHLVDLLVASGSRVRVLDDFSTGRQINLEQHQGNESVEVRHGSILDAKDVNEAAQGVDGVFHLAAAVGVFNIVNSPRRSLKVNILGTENVFDVALRHNLPVLVTSSSEIYGKNSDDELKEDSDRIIGAPQKLRWSYSDAKAIDEALAISAHRETGLKTKIVRLFNTVGPRQIGEYGMVMPRFIRAALRNEPIEIYGNGNQTRCFAHVSDVVRAIKLVFDSDNCIAVPLNIGVSQEISITNLAKLITQLVGSTSQIIYRKPSEVYSLGYEDMVRRVPNTGLLTNLTGWKPRISLDETILDIAKHMTINGV